jgi:hypothetical protein
MCRQGCESCFYLNDRREELRSEFGNHPIIRDEGMLCWRFPKTERVYVGHYCGEHKPKEEK